MTGDPFARIYKSFAKQDFLTTLGAKMTAVEDGSVEISAPITQSVSQQHGYAHAGLAFSLGDSAAGYAAMTLFDPSCDVVTAEMKINLLSPALGDSLIAIGRVIKLGRRLTVVAADVFAVRGDTRKLIAVLQGTMVPVDQT